MPNTKSGRVLAQVRESKHVIQALRILSEFPFGDAESIVRLHETLLFGRAYPRNPEVLRETEGILKAFAKRVSDLREENVDISALDDPTVSGIAGGSVTSNFSYAIVCWLVAKYPAQLSIDWDWFEEEDRFGATMPRFLPLLEEEAMVEAHVPYRDWLRAAIGGRSELVWLIARFEALNVSEQRKAELYDSLKLHVSWRFGVRSSRTGMKLPSRKIFFHDQPLIQRRDISLAAELSSPPIAVDKVSTAMGEKIL